MYEEILFYKNREEQRDVNDKVNMNLREKITSWEVLSARANFRERVLEILFLFFLLNLGHFAFVYFLNLLFTFDCFS